MSSPTRPMNRVGCRGPAKAATLAADPPRRMVISDCVSVAGRNGSCIQTTTSCTTSPMTPSTAGQPRVRATAICDASRTLLR
nr:hypothetical protein [Janibacter limosus]